MSIFNQFPWTNYREYNLDWVIRTVQEALENVYDTVQTYFSDHVDATLTHPGEAADAKKTGDEINNLKNRMTTAEGKITALEGYGYHHTVIRHTGGTWSYAAGDFDEAKKVLDGYNKISPAPTLDNIGSVVYQASLGSDVCMLISNNFNGNYVPLEAYDLNFMTTGGTIVSVTIKSDGTFV